MLSSGWKTSPTVESGSPAFNGPVAGEVRIVNGAAGLVLVAVAVERTHWYKPTLPADTLVMIKLVVAEPEMPPPSERLLVTPPLMNCQRKDGLGAKAGEKEKLAVPPGHTFCAAVLPTAVGGGLEIN